MDNNNCPFDAQVGAGVAAGVLTAVKYAGKGIVAGTKYIKNKVSDKRKKKSEKKVVKA